LLTDLLQKCSPLGPAERGHLLESSEGLEAAYATAALQGNTAPPDDAEADVDYHFICFVKSKKNGHLYELDGNSKGPTDKGPLLDADEDVLTGKALALVKEYINREEGGDINFGLMALVKS
jgi:ubiquitin carboxyl-terminal hydrolase L3